MTLRQVFDALPPRQFTPNGAFLIPFDTTRCAFFDNHSREFMGAAELYNVCRLLHVCSYFFSYDHDPESTHRGSAVFFAARFEDGQVQQRQVMVYRESGWVFAEHGEPWPFERVDAYAARKKKDRLNADLLRAYGEALNLPFWDETRYGTDVVLLRWGDKPADQTSTLKKIMNILGRPTWIMDRHGIRRPPD